MPDSPWVLLAALGGITLLIGKHAAFLGIYGIGTWWAWGLLG